MRPTVFTYDLPDGLVREHESPSGQNVLQRVLRLAIADSLHSVADPNAADFFYVPLSFHWGGRGRHSVAKVLAFLRHTRPHFNDSLRSSSRPNHLILFTGDLGPDMPPSRQFPDEPLPPEVDAASRSRHFVALTLTGNPEVGFQRGKDVVLPPTHNLKGGPMTSRDSCCGGTTVARCKPVVRVLEESPWRRRRRRSGGDDDGTAATPTGAGVGASAAAAAPPLRLLSWAGQASGGGMGRHGGSGPTVRRWLASQVVRWSDALITDSNQPSHRERNVKLLPSWSLISSTPGHARYGILRPDSPPLSTFCATAYGRGNGWEGRSAHAVREGCIPVRVQPTGSTMALEPFVPWHRFSVHVSDKHLDENESYRLRRRLLAIGPETLDRMRCEMACAATHMSWGVGVPPASCAAAAREPARQRRVGVVATLMVILGNRLLPPERRRRAGRCPCTNSSSEWTWLL
jgi:hypothetical protein